MTNRRGFLQFLASSPLFAQQSLPPLTINSPKDALNVMDFEAIARKNIPPAHFGYMTTGVDDDATLRANHEAMQKIGLRPRRLMGIVKADPGVTLFGTKWETPIFLCPVGSQRAFHPDGEIATAKAGNVKKHLQVLSTVTSSSVESVTEAAGRPVWYQLYASSNWDLSQKMIRRAEAAGSPVLVLTVDTLGGRNTETEMRFRPLDSRKCVTCHPDEPGTRFNRKPMYEGFDMKVNTMAYPGMTWDYVRKIRDSTKMKFVLKGVETREDAELCRKYGFDGIVVSNHGGRAEESGRGTIECLPEVVEGAGKDVPVLIDGGFRRGTDIFKALALGASAVGIGRPYIWGLGAFGQAGVERVLEMLRFELELVMRQCGTAAVKDINSSFVVARRA